MTASLWDCPFTNAAAAACGLDQAGISLWVGPASLAREAESVEIRGVPYRTFTADERRATQNSGMAVTFNTSTGSKVFYGRLQRIVEVNFSGQARIMLSILFFLESEISSTIPGTAMVRNSGRGKLHNELWIESSKIDGQVFFANDPLRAGWLHVFQYRGSGYVVPPHHYDASERMLDV